MRKLLLGLCIFVALTASAGAESLLQINSRFSTASYPFFGDGGKDVLRYGAGGIALRYQQMEGLTAVVDLGVLFPTTIEYLTYPDEDYVDISASGFPVSLEILAGAGYSWFWNPVQVSLTGGLHTALVIHDGNFLYAMGLGADAMAAVFFGPIFSAQIGVTLAVDFIGGQTFSATSLDFAGSPVSAGFYTGIGLQF